MSVVGMKTASVRSRQRSALSSASSRASGGARVRARAEERIMTKVRRVFIGTGMAQCYYTGAPGGSHLKDMWRSCNTLEVCLLLTRTQRRRFDSFNRMHMIWIDGLKMGA